MADFAKLWSLPMRTFRLVIACPDRVGIVSKVSNFLATYNGWITEASHHSDAQSGWFFMPVTFSIPWRQWSCIKPRDFYLF